MGIRGRALVVGVAVALAITGVPVDSAGAGSRTEAPEAGSSD